MEERKESAIKRKTCDKKRTGPYNYKAREGGESTFRSVAVRRYKKKLTKQKRILVDKSDAVWAASK